MDELAVRKAEEESANSLVRVNARLVGRLAVGKALINIVCTCGFLDSDWLKDLLYRFYSNKDIRMADKLLSRDFFLFNSLYYSCYKRSEKMHCFRKLQVP